MAKKTAYGSNSGAAPKSNASDKKKKGSGGKVVAALLIMALLGGGMLYMYKCTPACDSVKQYKAEYTSGSDMNEYASAYTTSLSDTTVVPGEPHTVDDTADAGLSGEELGGVFGGIFSSCQGAQPASDDTSGDRLVNVSASDESEEIISWQEVETDEAYRSLMTGKIDDVITLLTQLEDLKKELADCKSPAQVESNEQYADIKRQLIGWCNGAQTYSAAALGEDSRNASVIADDIASNIRSYLDAYPQAVCGSESAQQTTVELLEHIVTSVFSLQEAITPHEAPKDE